MKKHRFSLLLPSRYNWHCIQFYKIVLFYFIWSQDTNEGRKSRDMKEGTKTTCIVSRLVVCSLNKNASNLVFFKLPSESSVYRVWMNLNIKWIQATFVWAGWEISYLLRYIFNAFYRIMRLHHILQNVLIWTHKNKERTLYIWAFLKASFAGCSDKQGLKLTA